jgi:uncharacterized protein involved in exopolysaccharide biosynthesis
MNNTMIEQAHSANNELSLSAVARFLAQNFWTWATITLIFAVAALVLALNMTNLYRSDVVVSPADSSSGMSELGSQLGGLASLAGINLGGGGSKKSDEALEYLRSRVFTTDFIQRHQLMPILFAKKWDPVQHAWRDPNDPPSLSDAVTRFSKKVRQIAEDRRTGIVTVSIVWSDRNLAAEWANAMVAEADTALRERAVAQQSKSIEYLKSEAQRTNSVEVGSAISKLMETELKNAMVARTRDAYAFKVLDPAVPSDPKEHESPNRPLIVVVGGGVGFAVGVLVAAFRRSRRPRQ